MVLDARIVMAWLAAAVATVIICAPASGAPLAVGAVASSARLRVVAGGNATCPWQVSLLDAAGDDGDRLLCTGELGVSFGDPPNNAEFPTATSYSNFTTAVPLYVTTQPNSTASSDTRSKFQSGTTERPSAGAAAAAGAVVPPEGYERVGAAGFYKLHTRERLWHEARAACEREGAHLLVLDSAVEARALRRFLASKDVASANFPTYTLHAGFRLDLVTPQGERVMYESWSSSGPASRFCGQIDNDVWMLYGDCSDWKMFICEFEPWARTVSFTSKSLPVPLPTAECSKVKAQMIRDRGYVPLVGWNRTYVKDKGETSWNGAKKICEEDGAQIVTLESDEKSDALFAFLESSNIDNSFFIGVKTGLPVTVLGEPLEDKGYQRWASKSVREFCFFSNLKLQYYSEECDSSGSHSHYISSQVRRSICQISVF